MVLHRTNTATKQVEAPPKQPESPSKLQKHHHHRRKHHHDDSITESVERILLPAITVFFIVTLCIFYSATSDEPGPDLSSDEIQHSSGFWGGGGNEGYRFRPDEMPGVGDKSEKYRALREEFDAVFPLDGAKAHGEIVEKLHKRKYEPMERDIGYDIYNCPLHPPDGYPFTFNIVSEILSNWPADDTTPRPKVYMTFCVFDYNTEYEKAENYRNAELPFIVRNDPHVLRTASRWSHPHYLKRLLAGEQHRAEYSATNHFMYWSAPKQKRGKNRKDLRVGNKVIPAGWEEPTKMIKMTFEEWLSHADVPDDKLGPDHPHWYFRLIGCGKGLQGSKCDKNSSENLFDELPFFQPKSSLYIVEPKKQKGIHCRFGMKGVIAENHFDGSRNFIALLGGERRYILAHPEECPRLALFPKEHPSGRHSAVDWSDPDLEEYPQFKEAMGNEVVMQAGDVMYLPTNWFHYIISLEVNYQCNTRSGITTDYMKPLQECGFY